MKNANLKPGLIVYTCLIQTCVKYKKANLLIGLYNEMISYGIKGDPVFYNTLISGLVFNYYLKEACELTLFTLEKGLILNSDVYNNVLKNLCKTIERRYNNGLTKEECEMNLLKICQNMRSSNIEIEMGLYNQIAAILYQDKINIDAIKPRNVNSYQKKPNNYYQQNNNYDNDNGYRFRKQNTEGYTRNRNENEKPFNFFNRNMKQQN